MQAVIILLGANVRKVLVRLIDVKGDKVIDYSTRSIEIPKYIIVKPAATEELVTFLKMMKFDKVCFATQETVLDILPDLKESIDRKNQSVFLIDEKLSMDHLITKLDFIHNMNPDALVGIGGGAVLDTVKFFGHILNIPLILVPTLASNDGICSPVVSMRLESGRSDSLRARMPFALFADMNIIYNAPKKYLYAGLGDIISNISAVLDWELSAKLTGEQLDYFAKTLSVMSYKSLLNFKRANIDDENFVEMLVNSLITSGISMEYAGNSRSASGSEHMLSHAADMVFDTAFLHGHQTGFYTCVILKAYGTELYEKVLELLCELDFFSYLPQELFNSGIFLQILQLARSIRKRFTILNTLDDNQLIEVFENTVSEICHAISHTETSKARLENEVSSLKSK